MTRPMITKLTRKSASGEDEIIEFHPPIPIGDDEDINKLIAERLMEMEQNEEKRPT